MERIVMKTLTNKRAVRAFALKTAAERHHRFTRVGDTFIDRCEGLLRSFIREHIHRLPSTGKTIR
jgi:hypothetical protein